MRLGVLTFATDEGIGPVELGQALEQRGFDSLFLAEHSHIPVDAKTPYPMGGPIPPKYYRTLDPFVALTAARVTTTPGVTKRAGFAATSSARIGSSRSKLPSA